MAFEAGVEFTQRWIPVEEELPEIGEKVITKMPGMSAVACAANDSYRRTSSNALGLFWFSD